MTNQGRAARRQILGRESTTEGTQERMKDHNKSSIYSSRSGGRKLPLWQGVCKRGAQGGPHTESLITNQAWVAARITLGRESATEERRGDAGGSGTF